MRSSKYAFRGVPTHATTHTELCAPLVAALNQTTKHKSRAPGFIFQHRPSPPDRAPFTPALPHISCYTSANHVTVQNSDTSSRAELGYAEFFIEVKPDPSHDFLSDPSATADGVDGANLPNFFSQFEDEDSVTRVSRGLSKHISHVSEIFARQHRVFVFSVAVAGSRTRLFRWDRSGVVVTESFDIREQPEILCEFLWRFSCMSCEGRGHDLTVENASAEEELHYREAVNRHVREQTGFKDEDLAQAVSEHYQVGRVLAIHVFAQQPGAHLQRHRYLVSRPVVSPLSPVGRGTKAYWAYSTITSRIVLLKDTWRLLDENEGSILARLSELGVRHVPQFVHHGDVFNYPPSFDGVPSPSRLNRTKTDRYTQKPWVCPLNGEKPRLARHVQYRMVLETVGYGLERFQGTRELLHATYDVFQVMKEVLRLDSRLHRDISIGNIILVKETDRDIRRGYLIDWESSTSADEAGSALTPGRAGTWAFMSADVLTIADPTHTLRDDMESLIYVVLWAGLHYLKHNLGPTELARFIKEFFLHYQSFGSQLLGGTAKGANMGNRRMTKRVKFENPDFQRWLDTAINLLSTLQEADDDDDVEDKWSNPSHLESFWATFLTENTLEENDRVDNDIDGPILPVNVPTLTPPHSPSAPPHVSSSSKRKERSQIDTPTRRSERLSNRLTAQPPRGASQPSRATSTSRCRAPKRGRMSRA
ncbi:hypothetical protein C8Q80DRAFT_1218829 [Daedaleopsis nitida]|nr:hypothetical protein C8Q80DRAFT_1218829 [Daedaleopsis nitida]